MRWTSVLLLVGSCTWGGLEAGEDVMLQKDGRIIFQKPKNRQSWNWKATRWGMYQVVGKPADAKFTVSLADQEAKNGKRIYVAKAGSQVLKIGGPDAGSVKALSLVPAPEGDPVQQAESGEILLDAGSAITHGLYLRYEPQKKKRCLGFWKNPDDWAEWAFNVSMPGTFRVVLTQGCGKGHGASTVEVQVGKQVLEFEVRDTGGFQNWSEFVLGTVKISSAGEHGLSVKPVNKANGAVMDIHKIELIPVN